MKVKELISCVIPIVWLDLHIEGCVKAIRNSTYKDVEIIIVDEGLERSAQRNIGIKKANGEYLIWIDSDMRLHPGTLEDCVKKIKGHTAVYIPERIVTRGWFGRLRDWERQFYNGTLIDVVRFIRTEDCPLFDEALNGVEDSDWERRIKDRTFAISEYPFYHHDKVGLIKYLRKKSYYAQSLNAYRRKNPDDRLLTFKYRCVQVFIENGKWKRLLRSPHMAFGVMLLLFARGVIMKRQMWKYK